MDKHPFHLMWVSVSSVSLVFIYPDTYFKSLIHTLNVVLSLSLLYCPSPKFYLLGTILKPRVHLKYHVAAMGALLHDCSYCLMLSKKCALKDSLSTVIKIIPCWLRTLKLMIVFPKLNIPTKNFSPLLGSLRNLYKIPGLHCVDKIPTCC